MNKLFTRIQLGKKNTDIKRMFLKWSAVFLTLVLILDLVAANQVQANSGSNGLSQDYTFEEIDVYLEKQLGLLNIPGASLVIIEGDEIVHIKGFGVTGSSEKAPTPQTPYFIGSLTKSFTALAIMQLVEADKVELDAPIQRYLPWFSLANPQAAAQITVRHLLNQTSGLPGTSGMIALSNFDNSQGAAEQQARALATLELTRQVGSTWEYSNLNYNLLGLVIETASGESYADYIQKHIYAPLDMLHSHTSKAAAQQDNLAVGHQQWFGFPIAVPNLAVPIGSLASGQLISSVEDIGHYLIAQLNEGEYAGVQILSPEGIAQMHQPAADISVAGMGMGNYGMGWFSKEFSQGQLVFHYGEVPDYFAYMACLPEQNRAMVLLVNTNEQMFNYALWATSEAAALMLAGIPPRPNAWGILPWVVRGFLFLPVLQIIDILATLRKIKRWGMNPTNHPSSDRMWLLHILLPIILNLILIAIAVAILASGMFKFIMLFMGDLTSVLLVSSGIALVGIFVRTPLILRTFRTPSKRKLGEPS